jgi:WD40 repeat protein
LATCHNILPIIERVVPNKHPALSLAIQSDESLLAVGTEQVAGQAFIHFFDTKMNATSQLPKVTFSDSVSDDVTMLQFHPKRPKHLLTGSTDGIACVLDLKTWVEDEDLVGSMQSGSSIHRLGWFGPSGEYVWICTHVETFSLWTAEVCAFFTFVSMHHMTQSLLVTPND